MRHCMTDTDGRKQLLGEESVPLPLSSPHISHGLARDQTRAYVVEDSTELDKHTQSRLEKQVS